MEPLPYWPPGLTDYHMAARELQIRAIDKMKQSSRNIYNLTQICNLKTTNEVRN